MSAEAGSHPLLSPQGRQDPCSVQSGTSVDILRVSLWVNKPASCPRLASVRQGWCRVLVFCEHA